MVKDLSILYDAKMERPQEYSDDFGWLAVKAQELAREQGGAVMIRLRHGIPMIGRSTFQKIRYDGKGEVDTNLRDDSFTLPTPLLQKLVNDGI